MSAARVSLPLSINAGLAALGGTVSRIRVVRAADRSPLRTLPEPTRSAASEMVITVTPTVGLCGVRRAKNAAACFVDVSSPQ